MTKAPDVSTPEMLIFQKGIKAVFKIYDTDKSGDLDYDELRILIDDCRASMYLPNCDEDIFIRIVEIIDDNHDGSITIEEL
jgi:Ca2+-binding EF-hand superfamily protein